MFVLLSFLSYNNILGNNQKVSIVKMKEEEETRHDKEMSSLTNLDEMTAFFSTHTTIFAPNDRKSFSVIFL